MKFKKSMFILILAVFFISIAGVCASDANDTVLASQENTAIESTYENLQTVEDNEPAVSTAENGEILSASVDDEIVGAENDLDVLSADSAKYSDLANEVGSGGNIKLKHKYYTYDSGYIMITQSNSVIDGNGAIIDMTGTNIFAFYIDYRALGTTIKNLTIKNSGASEGSGVYAWSPCTIENCSFINNQAWDNGGAVFFRLSGKVINCYFESNRVTGSNGTGGAVYIEGNGEVINCSFNGNRADGSGAVYIAGNGSVINCNFKDNSASDGGAVCISSTGTVKNCNFTNNTVNSTGAAVFILTRGTVENSNFVNNTAGEYGGAVQMMAGTVKNCNFTNNTAGEYGGAVYIYPLDGTVENCNFNYNSASDGGAVRLGSATVKNCNFTNNSAENYGGAITLRNEGNVTNCNFVNNTCENYGGALQIGSGTVTNCNFTNNSASSSDGGAVFIYDGGVVTNCNFVNNTAGEYGGALTFYENGNVTNCNFVNNTGGEYGGALAFYENGNVTNSNFTNNQALNGGAILIYGEGIVENCIFVNNHADNRAGGIIIYEGVVTNCNFTNNTGLYGAAIYAFDGFNVENCNFVNNIVGKAGGAVLIYDIGTVENCNFTNNSADAGGAVMFYDNSEMTNCNFNNNSASSGGAVYFLEGGKLTNSNFTNNSAILYGGAIYIYEDGIVENCNFNGNNASGGGAIRIIENSTVTNCNFNDNYASEGGAVFIYDDGVVTGCSFINNSATLSGGAIELYNVTDGVVSGCIFVNNSADNGTIYYNNTEYGSNLTINDNIFLNNDGVAIYFVKSDSTSNVDYNWFGNNATNYDIEPITNNAEMSTWLFLNATANPDAISILDSSDIIFKLYAYTPSGVSEYDNSRLKAVNLTLTPTNGRINTTKTELGEPVHYTAEVGRMGKLTASIENASYTISLLISDGTTFCDLNKTINGNDNDTIVLDRDYTYNSIFDYNLNEGIVINRPLRIVGNGHTLNATGLARIFSIQANNVVIENITFVNGKTDRHAGAIFWSGNNANISDCIFVNNSADGQGAAINLDGDDSVVSNCIFVNNNAYSGGAVYWSGDNGSVSGCSFVNNSASDGGALTFMGYKGSVSGCSFVNNSARLDGGAIYLDESDESIVSNCSFVNNSASEGGAISLRYTKEGIVSDCSFVNNSASDDGGAVYWSGDNGNVSSCSFVNNRANYGIVYFDNSLYGHLSVNDNIFLNNDGVAIYFVDSDSTSNADYNWFGNNATNYDVAPTTTNVVMDNWLFLNATANPDKISISDVSDIVFKLYSYSEEDDGISDYDNSRLPVVNLTLTPTNGRINTTWTGLKELVQYTSEGNGIGKITAKIENATYTISLLISDGTTFFDLNRTINGNDNDTILLDRDYTYNSTVDFDFTEGIVINRPMTIVGNGNVIDATGLARIFHIQADNVAINNITFINAYSSGYGGAVFWEGANGNVSGCLFANNSAAMGGAIEFYGSAGSMVSDCIFMNNSAMYGGAIYWNSADGVVCDCSFMNNSANNGGAVYWNSADGVVCDCSFVNNSAVRNGGAIYWVNNNGNVSGCIFVNNSAEGTIYFNNQISGQNFTINDNIFLNNDGVAIYFVRTDSVSNADYNWFGNNATNYDIVPTTNNVEISTWLFLNATANPNPVEILELSDVSFKLYSYNATGISDYDNSRLQPVNLTLTATNGNVDSIAKLGETVKYEPTGLGNGSVTAKIENAEYTIEINNIKSNPNLSVESNEITYSNNTAIALNYESAATGKVNITLKGKKYDYTFVNQDLNATISLGAVGADEYDVIVEYSGDDIFSNATVTGTLTVNKANSTLNVSDIKFDYKDMGSGEISFTGATGVDAQVIGNDEAMIFIKGNTITVLNLTAGSYNLTVTTISDANHTAVTENATITVRKINSTINVNDIVLYYGESVNVTVTTDSTNGITAESDINVEVNGYFITIPADLESGNHTLTITAVPDENHNEATKTVKIVDLRIGNITVIVDGVEYTIPAVNGTNITTNMSEEIEKLKENITNLTSQLEEAQNNASSLANELEEAKQNITDLNTQLEEALANVTNLTDELADAKQNITDLTAQLEEAQNNASNLVGELADAKQNITDLSGKLEEALDNVTNLVGELADAKQNITDLSGKLEEALANVTNLVGELADAKQNITDLTSQLEEAEANVTKLVEELKDAKQNITDLSGKLEEAQANVTKLAEDLADANQKVDDLTAQLEDANANASSLANELEEAKQNITDLTTQLEEAQANVTKLTEELDDANQKVDDLTGELEDAQANVTKLVEELDDANQTIDDLIRQLEEALANATKIETVVVDGEEYPVEYVNGTAVVNTNKTSPVLPETVVVDGKEYPIEYVNGTATVTTDPVDPVLPETVIVDGKEYPTEIVDGKVTVKTNATEPVVKERLGTIITADDFTQYSCDYYAGERGGYFIGLLTDSNGNPLVNKTVQIGYNGLNFNRTTNETGHFAVQIGLQNAGLYTFGMAYLDDNDYNASFLVRGITIVKKPTSIVAKNKAFKASKKTKKLTVKLKTIVGSAIDGKVYLKEGKKLTLKVNGVTYKAKTNAKGKATFKITKLNKKGKYKAKIKFAGDTYVYKKSSKKIKITVK